MYWSACSPKWTCVSLCFFCFFFFCFRLCSSLLLCLVLLFCVLVCLFLGVWLWLLRWLPAVCVGVCLFAFTCKLVDTHYAAFLSVCAKRSHIFLCVCVLYEHIQFICAFSTMISATFLLCSVCVCVCVCVCEVGVSGAPVVRLHWPLCYCSLIINYRSPPSRAEWGGGGVCGGDNEYRAAIRTVTGLSVWGWGASKEEEGSWLVC